jgi:hypothetical protein
MSALTSQPVSQLLNELGEVAASDVAATPATAKATELPVTAVATTGARADAASSASTPVAATHLSMPGSAVTVRTTSSREACLMRKPSIAARTPQLPGAYGMTVLMCFLGSVTSREAAIRGLQPTGIAEEEVAGMIPPAGRHVLRPVRLRG